MWLNLDKGITTEANFYEFLHTLKQSYKEHTYIQKLVVTVTLRREEETLNDCKEKSICLPFQRHFLRF